MKKLLLFILVIIFAVYFYNENAQKRAEEDMAADYAKIEQVQSACDIVAKSGLSYTLGSNAGQWYVFELEFIHQKDDKLHAKMESELGEDFVTKLSNGDSIFVGFLPYRGSYRIYAGGTGDANMIYPEWKYTKLMPRE